MNHDSFRPADALLAVGGPLILGAIISMRQPLSIALKTSLALPLIIVGVAAATLPALYIGASLTGIAPPAREVGAAAVRALRAFGIALLGLAAPTAFVLATSEHSTLAALLGGAAAAAGALACLRILFADLFRDSAEPLTARAVFALWTLVVLGIGARMFTQLIAA